MKNMTLWYENMRIQLNMPYQELCRNGHAHHRNRVFGSEMKCMGVSISILPSARLHWKSNEMLLVEFSYLHPLIWKLTNTYIWYRTCPLPLHSPDYQFLNQDRNDDSHIRTQRESTRQLTESNMRNQKHFTGVYDADSLPRSHFMYPWAIIVNTEKDTVPLAGNWMAFVFNKFGQVYYFDSYRLSSTCSYWKHYLHTNSHGKVWFYNRLIVQRYENNICGYLCMDYITQRLRKPTLRNQTIVCHLDEYKLYYKFVYN